MTVLPAELVDEVFSHCCNDTLARCALANKAFLHRIRPRLYYAIRETDSARASKLPYSMKSLGITQIFNHTRHLAIQRCRIQYIPFLQGMHRLGRLETISQGHRGALTYEASPYLDVLFQICSLPSFRRLKLILHSFILRGGSRSICTLLSSPKLRDFALSPRAHHRHRHEPFPDSVVHHLDTLRMEHYNWVELPTFINYATLRRLSFQSVEIVDLQTPQSQNSLKNLFTYVSCNLTHLAVQIGDETQTESDIATLVYYDYFPHLDKLRSLTSLKLDFHDASWIPPFELSSCMIAQLSQGSPLCSVRIFMPRWYHRNNTSDASYLEFQRFSLTMKDCFPQAQLFVHFYYDASNTMRAFQDVEGVFYDLDEGVVIPVFSGEITDDCIE